MDIIFCNNFYFYEIIGNKSRGGGKSRLAG
jgi:hypothetical protein